jgi:squalene-hopene/tetraprenyl-beta-curcumene cyclase
MKTLFARTVSLITLFAAPLTAQSVAQSVSHVWNEQKAADYLDARIGWWMNWTTSQRDHDTFCVSCHTAVPYAMSRPSLRTAQEGSARTQVEWRLLDNVTKRVRMWAEVEPFYPDAKRGVPKTFESRGTESVLNAVILTSYDAPLYTLNRDSRTALDNMWAQQITTGPVRGAWPWLQFHNAPWEGDSQFYGTTLAAIAIGNAPAAYRATPEIQAGLKLLRDYFAREQESQFLIDRVVLLWASTSVPGILTPAQQQSIIATALAKQRSDGGFSLSSLVGNWKRADSTALETQSDGYATGLIALALQKAGVPPTQPQLHNAIAWLRSNQDPAEGRWLAWSLNKQRDLSTDIGHFMSDAATAYAVMALKYPQPITQKSTH